MMSDNGHIQKIEHYAIIDNDVDELAKFMAEKHAKDASKYEDYMMHATMALYWVRHIKPQENAVKPSALA